MIRNAFIALAMIAASGLAQAAQSPSIPLDAQNEKDPRVVAFYETRCNDHADENGLKGDARSAFVAKCLKGMPTTYPVGYDQAKGDGGGE